MKQIRVEKLKQDIREIVAEVKEKREELKLQMHLGRAESRDDWEKTEKKLQELKTRADLLGEEAKADVGKAVKAVTHELKKAYSRIQRHSRRP